MIKILLTAFIFLHSLIAQGGLVDPDKNWRLYNKALQAVMDRKWVEADKFEKEYSHFNVLLFHDGSEIYDLYLLSRNTSHTLSLGLPNMEKYGLSFDNDRFEVVIDLNNDLGDPRLDMPDLKALSNGAEETLGRHRDNLELQGTHPRFAARVVESSRQNRVKVAHDWEGRTSGLKAQALQEQWQEYESLLKIARPFAWYWRNCRELTK